MLLLEGRAQPLVVGVEVHKILLAVLLEVDLVDRTSLRDVYPHMKLVECAGVLSNLLLEVVYRVLLRLWLSQQEIQQRDGHQHRPVEPVQLLELLVSPL